ncbi:MAG TPA: hypothetical protein VK327_06035 [Candidatus Paceibacterota bacterium]|nr:hypothetical protein [Candidatus Paceibacterota bacterium]
MQKRLSVGLVLLASLVGQFASFAVILPPPVKTVTLTWNYPVSDPEIVFNVYGTTNLALPLMQWPLLSTVTNLSCTLPMQDRCFFTVTASNVVTGLESSRGN